MDSHEIRLLLIEDEEDDIVLLREMIREGSDLIREGRPIELIQASSIKEAFKKLDTESIDIILSDLTLHDSKGFDTVLCLRERAADIPIIVLTGFDDVAVALNSLQQGIQDYLIKGHITGEMLYRAVLYSLERFKLFNALKSLALIDELTGLYNRRGFFALANNQLKLAQRRDRRVVIMYADLDKMKSINDQYGHKEGDRALKVAANILQNVFRSTDIIGRIGGDEFAVMAIEAEEIDPLIFEGRMEKRIAYVNEQEDLPFEIAISYGTTMSLPKDINSIEEALVQTDRVMYERKRMKPGH